MLFSFVGAPQFAGVARPEVGEQADAAKAGEREGPQAEGSERQHPSQETHAVAPHAQIACLSGLLRLQHPRHLPSLLQHHRQHRPARGLGV